MGNLLFTCHLRGYSFIIITRQWVYLKEFYVSKTQHSFFKVEFSFLYLRAFFSYLDSISLEMYNISKNYYVAWKKKEEKSFNSICLIIDI